MREDLVIFSDKNDEATVLIDMIHGHGSKVYRFTVMSQYY